MEPIKKNLPTLIILKCLEYYKKFISPLLGHRCRFYPSCSSYTAEAVQRYGALKGLSLGGRRLLKCHPLHPGGIDLVP